MTPRLMAARMRMSELLKQIFRNARIIFIEVLCDMLINWSVMRQELHVQYIYQIFQRIKTKTLV